MITLISLIITIVGALNWLSVGTFGVDFIAWIFGGPDMLFSRIIYILVGVAGIWLIANVIRKRGRVSEV